MDDLVVGATNAVIHPIYVISVLAGFALILFFPVTRDFSNAREKSQYYYLQLIMLLGAIFGAKLAVLMGDALWPLQAFTDWVALIYSGRSIVGALLFGFLFSEVAKPLIGYRRPPNDRFAILLPFSIATGRIGCWYAGCCLGVPMEARHVGMMVSDVPLHPIALYEIAFHLSVGAVLIMMFRQRRFQGQLFAIFMVAYGTFRFASEALRATEKAFYGLSAYQWFAAALILAGMMSYSARRQTRQLENARGA